jgi:hypothetical protein
VILLCGVYSWRIKGLCGRSWRITKTKHQTRIDDKVCQEMGFNKRNQELFGLSQSAKNAGLLRCIQLLQETKSNQEHRELDLKKLLRPFPLPKICQNEQLMMLICNLRP